MNHSPENRRMSPAEIEAAIAQARRMSDEADRNLDVVQQNVLAAFQPASTLHTLVILGFHDQKFEVYVFFNSDADLEASRTSGLADQITDRTYLELERAGRGIRSELNVRFEFDSDERVERDFNGNHYNRLH